MFDVTFEISKYLLSTFLIFYVTGELVQKYIKIGLKDACSIHFLRLALGLLLVPVFYRILALSGAKNAVLLASLSAPLIFWLWSKIRSVNVQAWRTSDTIVLLSIFACSTVLLLNSHFADFMVFGDQVIYRATQHSESAFHEGLVNSLRFQYPPPALYAAGSHDFGSYHLNMHLQIEAINRLSGIPVNRLVYWYFPMLFFVLLGGLSFTFIRSLGGTIVAGIGASILIFLAGFSWIPGIMNFMPEEFPWILFFHGAPFGLYTLNGITPAVIGLLTVVILMSQRDYLRTASSAMILSLMLYGIFGIKSSMGLQLAGSLLLVGLLFRQKEAVLSGSIAIILMIADLALLRSGIGNNLVAFSPFGSVKDLLYSVGITDVHAVTLVLALLLIFGMEMGVRLLGLSHVKHIWSKSPHLRKLITFLLIFVLGGYIIPEVIYLGDTTFTHNNATWFCVQAVFAGWLLLFIYLAESKLDSSKQTLTIVLLIALSIPSVIQFNRLKQDSTYTPYGPDDWALVAYIETTPLDSVFLHPFNETGPSHASQLAGRMSVLNVFHSFLDESHGFSERVSDTQAFFDPETPFQDRKSILRKYKVTHVYGPGGMTLDPYELLDLKLEYSNQSFKVWRDFQE